MTGVQTCALPISENRVHVASPSAGYARHPNETCRGRQDLAAGIASRDAAARGSTRLSLAAWWNRRRSRRCRSCGSLNSRSEEHTSELQSLMRISYAVFCLKTKKKKRDTIYNTLTHESKPPHPRQHD